MALTRAAERAASLFGQGERFLLLQWPMFNTGSAPPAWPADSTDRALCPGFLKRFRAPF
jgi:hypothetical protein